MERATLYIGTNAATWRRIDSESRYLGNRARSMDFRDE